MKINLNKRLKDLSGKEIENSDMSKLVAQSLANSSAKENTVKMYYWATKLYNGEELDLDPTDQQLLKQLIEQNAELTVLAKAQILNEL